MSSSEKDIPLFTKVEDVPIVAFAVVRYNHPSIEIIKKAYQLAGAGLGVLHSKN